MKLTIAERIKLLEALPPQGDILTLKILRKLRETLSFSEQELKSFDISREYVCDFSMTDKVGKMEKCTNKGFFKEQPTCGVHEVKMVETGQMSFFVPPEVMVLEKDIYMGAKALELSSGSLKKLNDQKLLTEAHVSLYEKFFPPDEEENASQGEKG